MKPIEIALLDSTSYRRILIAKGHGQWTSKRIMDVFNVSLATAKRDLRAVKEARWMVGNYRSSETE